MDRLLDGQFDESSLTLREIRIVEDSLVKSLIGMHHGRIKYPDQKDWRPGCSHGPAAAGGRSSIPPGTPC